jgi:large subunit ribosomal protein L17
MLSNMASSLILHKRITTTLAKAKALRKYVEPILTRSKDNTTHSRRVVFSYLQNKESVKELFDVVSDKVATRPGGYTRIIRLGNRLGDNAETCMMELVDFNETMQKDSATGKTRRGRRSRSKSSNVEAKAEATPAEKPEATQADDSVSEEKE